MANLTRATGNITSQYTDEAEMIAAGSPSGRMVALFTGERYAVALVNAGDGILLSTGNFANPVSDPRAALKNATIIPQPSSGDFPLLPEYGGTTQRYWKDLGFTLDIPLDAAQFDEGMEVSMLFGGGLAFIAVRGAAGVLVNGVDGGHFGTDNTTYTGFTLLRIALDEWECYGNVIENPTV